MSPRLRHAILVYWYILQIIKEREQSPLQDRGSNIVCLDSYRRKKRELETQ